MPNNKKEIAIKENLGSVIVVVFDTGNQSPIVLYELLIKKGYAAKFVYYLDDNLENRKAFISLIQANKAIMIGFSFASHSAPMVFELSAYLSSQYPGIPIIFGGVHPTIDPISCLDYCDAVCIGEGDIAIQEIVEKICTNQDYHSSKNLVYRKNRNIVRNPLHPLNTDLDSLPIRRCYTPDHMVIEKGKVLPVDRKRFYQLMPYREFNDLQFYSRGCPFNCAYCCNSKFHAIYPNWGCVRSPSVQTIIKEISEIIRLNPAIIRFFITDDCFLAHDVNWLRDFVQQWKEKVNKSLTVFSIPDYVTQDKLKVLKEIQLDRIAVGLQSGSKKINAIYNRRFSPEKFLEVCRLIRSLGIALSVDLIFDSPWEDDNDILDTLNVLTRIPKPFWIMNYSLKIYPGTKLYDDYIANNVKIPALNQDYQDYQCIRMTDKNRILILSQFLPRKLLFWLFKNRHRKIVTLCIRTMYIFTFLLLPFRINLVVSGGIRQKLTFLYSYRRNVFKFVKNLLGVKRPSCRT